MGQECKSAKNALRGNCYETCMFQRSTFEKEQLQKIQDEILNNERIKGDDRHRLTSIQSVEEHEKDLSSQGQQELNKKKQKRMGQESSSVDRPNRYMNIKNSNLKRSGGKVTRSNQGRAFIQALDGAKKDLPYYSLDQKKDPSKKLTVKKQNTEERAEMDFMTSKVQEGSDDEVVHDVDDPNCFRSTTKEGQPEIIYIERNRDEDEHEDLEELRMLEAAQTNDEDYYSGNNQVRPEMKQVNQLMTVQRSRQQMNKRPTTLKSSFKSEQTVAKPKQMKKVDNIGGFYQINYKYFEMLGNGAFGTVRPCKKVKGLESELTTTGSKGSRCINSTLSTRGSNEDMQYAVKIIPRKKVDRSKTYKQLLQNEFEILNECDHPKIMKIQDLYYDKENYYVVSELLSGGPVSNRLRSTYNGFSEVQTYVIIRQLLSALQFLHSKNITHRDLKLENVLFKSMDQDNFNIKVVDFGFATKFDPSEGMNLVLGSPLFMAPELVKKQKGYTEKVDVWALGCIMYLLICGENIFKAMTVKKINELTLTKPIYFTGVKWNSISKQCKNFITLCLQREPTRRLSIEKLQEHAWITQMSKSKPRDFSELDSSGDEMATRKEGGFSEEQRKWRR